MSGLSMYAGAPMFSGGFGFGFLRRGASMKGPKLAKSRIRQFLTLCTLQDTCCPPIPQCSGSLQKVLFQLLEVYVRLLPRPNKAAETSERGLQGFPKDIDIYMYLHGSVQAPTGNASSVSRFFDIAATRSCALWARSYFHPIPDQAKQTFRSAFFVGLANSHLHRKLVLKLSVFMWVFPLSRRLSTKYR